MEQLDLYNAMMQNTRYIQEKNQHILYKLLTEDNFKIITNDIRDFRREVISKNVRLADINFDIILLSNNDILYNLKKYRNLKALSKTEKVFGDTYTGIEFFEQTGIMINVYNGNKKIPLADTSLSIYGKHFLSVEFIETTTYTDADLYTIEINNFVERYAQRTKEGYLSGLGDMIHNGEVKESFVVYTDGYINHDLNILQPVLTKYKTISLFEIYKLKNVTINKVVQSSNNIIKLDTLSYYIKPEQFFYYYLGDTLTYNTYFPEKDSVHRNITHMAESAAVVTDNSFGVMNTGYYRIIVISEPNAIGFPNNIRSKILSMGNYFADGFKIGINSQYSNPIPCADLYDAATLSASIESLKTFFPDYYKNYLEKKYDLNITSTTLYSLSGYDEYNVGTSMGFPITIHVMHKTLKFPRMSNSFLIFINGKLMSETMADSINITSTDTVTTVDITMCMYAEYATGNTGDGGEDLPPLLFTDITYFETTDDFSIVSFNNYYKENIMYPLVIGSDRKAILPPNKGLENKLNTLVVVEEDMSIGSSLVIPSNNYTYMFTNGVLTISFNETITIDAGDSTTEQLSQPGINSDSEDSEYLVYSYEDSATEGINTTRYPNLLRYDTEYTQWGMYNGDYSNDANGLHMDGSICHITTSTHLKSNTKYLLLYKLDYTTAPALSMIFHSYADHIIIPNALGYNVKILETSTQNYSQDYVSIGKFEYGDMNITLSEIRLIELPVGSALETDANTLSPAELNKKYPTFRKYYVYDTDIGYTQYKQGLYNCPTIPWQLQHCDKLIVESSIGGTFPSSVLHPQYMLGTDITNYRIDVSSESDTNVLVSRPTFISNTPQLILKMTEDDISIDSLSSIVTINYKYPFSTKYMMVFVNDTYIPPKNIIEISATKFGFTNLTDAVYLGSPDSTTLNYNISSIKIYVNDFDDYIYPYFINDYFWDEGIITSVDNISVPVGTTLYMMDAKYVKTNNTGSAIVNIAYLHVDDYNYLVTGSSGTDYALQPLYLTPNGLVTLNSTTHILAVGGTTQILNGILTRIQLA